MTEKIHEPLDTLKTLESSETLAVLESPEAHETAGGSTSSRSPEDLGMGEPAEVLVELARRGEIDPWDIDIARTTEKFLEYIDSLERRDLRIPARTLLYASILLRMKSDAVEEREVPVEEPLPEIVEEFFDEAAPDTLPAPPVRRRTKRPVTLDELITELKKAEMVGRRKAMRELWPEVPAEKPLDLSHEEGIEDRIRALEPIIDDALGTRESVTLGEISEKKDIMNYISLLFMAQRKKVWLEQEEFFGELYIKRPQRPPPPGQS